MNRPCDGHAEARVDAAEGRVPPSFARHLEGCPECTEAVAALRSDLEVLAPDPAPVPGPWLATSVRRAAESRRQGRRGRLVVFGPLTAAAAGLVLVVVAATSGREPVVAPPPPSDASTEIAYAYLDASDDWDPDLFDLGWDAGWGLEVEGVLADADTAALQRLADRLPP